MNYKQALAHAKSLAAAKRLGRLPAAIPFPDLSTAKPGLAPTSDRITRVTYRAPRPADAAQFPIQYLHKQGPMILTPGDRANPDAMRHAGGKKS